MQRPVADQLARACDGCVLLATCRQCLKELSSHQQIRHYDSAHGQALRRQRYEPSSQYQGGGQNHKPEERNPFKPPKPRNNKGTDRFFDYNVTPMRPRKPVRWSSPQQAGTTDDRSLEASSQQASQQAPQEVDWLLGEGQPPPQPGSTRPRLSWASHHVNQPSAHASRNRSQHHPQHSQNSTRFQQSQQPHAHPSGQQWPSQQAAFSGRQQQPQQQQQQQPLDPAAQAAQRDQYLRNMQQIQRQEADHEMRKNRRQPHAQSLSGVLGPREVTYQDLTAGSKHKHKGASKAQPAVEAAPKEVVLPPDVTLRQLAQLLGLESTERLEAVLADVGDAPTSIEDRLAIDSAELAVMEFGRTAVISKEAQEVDADAQPRPAVITVMGHVDHGKTSLLDALRKTSVAAGEAGGITQHIGAFEVQMPDSQQSLTFLDTPGHAAFSAMRARGAAITDVVVLVVAADDGVMPQTREALAHCKAAGCPIVVALTKCDVPMAEPARVRQQLIAEGLELEEVGGSVQVVETAATRGQGLLELEEALMLQAEGLELQASHSRPAEAVIVEAKLDKGQGPIATAIVKRGTLAVGQYVAVGTEWGKVRSLKTAASKSLKKALPGQPVEIAGLKGVPQAGDQLQVLPSEERAKRVSEARSQRAGQSRHGIMLEQVKQQQQAAQQALDEADPDAPAQPAAPEERNLTLMIKADVQGSGEAVREAVMALADDVVGVRLVSQEVGPVTTTDIDTAFAVGASILAFNVKFANAAVEGIAKLKGVPVVQQNIIYRLLEQVNNMLAAEAPMIDKEVVVGQADVLQVFELKGKQPSAVAGCRVTDGNVQQALQWRVMRGGEPVYEGKCGCIKRHKLEVERVGKGTECGVTLQEFADFRLGDVLQCISIEKVPAKQQSATAG